MKNNFKFIKNSMYHILTILNSVVPKKKRIFINSGSRLYDNNEVMFNYLLIETDYEIICTSNEDRCSNLRKNAKMVRYSHLLNIYYILTSTVIIDSFLRPIKMHPKKGQISIQLWHGTPLKYGGFTKEQHVSECYTHIACPSLNYFEINKKIFCSDGKNIFINGNPRNDLLFYPELGKYRKHGKEKYILWLPTYRHGLGRAESNIDLPIVNADNINLLNNCLRENNIKLFIKPHPLQTNSLDNCVKNTSNIILITDNMLKSENIPLYNFIGGMDALLTDYSSVFYDFLLLDRPIGFVIEDLDVYKKMRGFVFDDPLSMMPGAKIYNINDLKNFISTLGSVDEYAEERKKINLFANYYRDGKNRERILDIVRIAMEK